MRRQEGSLGWSKAQERDLMAGWAGDVMGEMEQRLLGRVSVSGNRMGETKGGHRAREICARLLTISKGPGHERPLGKFSGRFCM